MKYFGIVFCCFNLSFILSCLHYLGKIIIDLINMIILLCVFVSGYDTGYKVVRSGA